MAADAAGALMPIDSSRLPLSFVRRRVAYDAAALLLPFKRRLGEAEAPDLPGSPDYPSNPAAPKKRRMDLSGGAAAQWQENRALGICTHAVLPATATMQLCLIPRSGALARVSRCFSPQADVLAELSRCARFLQGASQSIKRCQSNQTDSTEQISRCQSGKIAAAQSLSRCASTFSTASQALGVRQQSIWQDSDYLSRCASINTSAAAEIMRCQTAQYKAAVPVPWEYYPLPLPKPPPTGQVCPIRPPSDRLPLTFRRRVQTLDSSIIPLPFVCWDDETTGISTKITVSKAYIMQNHISCTIDGKAVNILSANIKTDMASYCWQGEVAIAPADFAKIDRNKPKGDEPLIELNINGTRWIFALEDVRDNRQFVAYSYSLSGRSLTARLGADYAKTKTGVIKEPLYARQIADSVLQYSDYQIRAWEIADWLIPADTYDLSGKTPLAVIADIADIAGGFVESDKTAKKLYIRPRWRQPAWEIAQTTAALEVPSSVIVSISGQQQSSPRYNAVRLHGNSKGMLIYRQNEDRAAEAGVQHHALYSDTAPMIAQGKALLSESGNHKAETLKMPWSDKYRIPLAALGAIWQVNESGGAWRGVVQGVSIEISLEGDAPTLWQTVTLDRYMDK